jgi:diguanylate cyclase (GGDEF)-like protein
MDSGAPSPSPLVLLVDNLESTARSLELVLRPRGHVVLKALTGQQAIDLLSKVNPDVILVKVSLPDIDGIELVQRLRGAPTVHGTTPILTISSEPLGRADRLEALGAGAWDVLTLPVDPNELILRMDTFVRAKQEADRVRDQGTTDPSTGFYNVRGILQRAKEITAEATRFDRSVTCVAFGQRAAKDATGGHESAGAIESLNRPIVEALRAVTRICDTIGCLGPGEFVVVAPGTDQEGALRLADRVLDMVEAEVKREGFGLGPEALSSVRAGVFAATNSEPTSPEDLLLRATLALRKAQSEDGSFRVRAYDA